MVELKGLPQCRRHKRHRFDPWVGKIPWRRIWQPTPVFLRRKSHGQRSWVGYSPYVGCKESDTTEATVGDRGQADVSLTPDVDGTGSGSLLNRILSTFLKN